MSSDNFTNLYVEKICGHLSHFSCFHRLNRICPCGTKFPTLPPRRRQPQQQQRRFHPASAPAQKSLPSSTTTTTTTTTNPESSTFSKPSPVQEQQRQCEKQFEQGQVDEKEPPSTMATSLVPDRFHRNNDDNDIVEDEVFEVQDEDGSFENVID